MRLKSRLAVRMNEAKLMAQRCDSSSNFSVSSVESGGGRSSSFSGSVQSEDGEAWSPPRQVQQSGGSGKEAWSPLCVAQSGISETEMMKERFSRLLLGEDMSGSGKGVSTSLAISNGITNLYASIFGELGRLEALPMEKKEMWRREMDWFLSVTDHIVEMTPSYKTFPDGTKLEIMTCKQRSDLFINLPALRKLDSMLIELFEGFSDAEFWYIDQGKVDVDADGSVKILERQKEKWWLPVPQIPEAGLSIDSKRQLLQKRECAVQILKAALSINTDTISEMEVPDSYLETLPKTGKACLGDQLYRFLASDHFSVESVFDCLDLSADHVVSELVNRLEAAINLWRKRSQSSLVQGKSSSAEAERKELFSGRAEDLLLALKHQFHHLPQTTLEATKIQCNKDIGKSILESYSRVLESLAYNMVARIDDLQSMDTLANNRPGKFSLASTIMTPPHHTTSIPYSGPLTRSPSRSEIVPFLNKLPRHSNLAKRVLANYLCSDSRSKNHRHSSKDDSSVLAISNPRTDTVMPPRGTSTELSSPRKS